MNNAYNNRPMPYGAKVRKVLSKQFYLSSDRMEQLIIMLECSTITRMRDVVDYIEEKGGWLD